MCASFFRGTQLDQNVKFQDKNKKLMKEWSWPKIFDQKVDVSKVNLTKINAWIEQRITELLGDDDDIVINFAISQLEESTKNATNKFLCPKNMQISLTGFLTKNTAIFMEELWALLLSAQSQPDGIPPELQQLSRQKEAIASGLNDEAKQKLQKFKDIAEMNFKSKKGSRFTDGNENADVDAAERYRQSILKERQSEA